MYQSFEPAPALSPFVECYWSWQVEPDGRMTDDILPDASPEFILHSGSPPHAKGPSGEWTQQMPAFFYCAANRGLSLSIRQPMQVFAIRFRPWGLSRFTQHSMLGLLDRPVAPFEALHELGDELVAGLAAKDTDPGRVACADQLLSLALRSPARNEKRMKLLLDACNGGRCSSSEIARSLAMSDRAFNRLWRDIVGIQPRRFVQIMRFQSALTRIAAGESLSGVAAECGYSDQAHMARQIKSISGLSPSSLRRRLGDRTYSALYESRPGAPWHERDST